ncbi:MAG TPA: RHS repeat-associated core domain-containing protein, partial [Pyrinomonadaceae bacterium]|nr:RHS repeat-associated core domain-containing protein [Pyrinomonadaceae bacterium]
MTSEAANKSAVKDVSVLSQKELADIPPEAFHPQPPMPAGYNAHSGALPPGALPPGVSLPGKPAMQGARTSAQGYGMNDGVRQQFTSKERDTETGLDYFGARYYSSAQGRFTSVDPVTDFKKNVSNPQRWNQY